MFSLSVQFDIGIGSMHKNTSNASSSSSHDTIRFEPTATLLKANYCICAHDGGFVGAKTCVKLNGKQRIKDKMKKRKS